MHSEDRPSGHVDGVEVRDGAGGADVAAHRGRVPDLVAGKVLHLLAHRLVCAGLVLGPLCHQLLHLLHQLGQGDCGTDRQPFGSNLHIQTMVVLRPEQ